VCPPRYVRVMEEKGQWPREAAGEEERRTGQGDWEGQLHKTPSSPHHQRDGGGGGHHVQQAKGAKPKGLRIADDSDDGSRAEG
jgi:hypothetical protein